MGSARASRAVPCAPRGTPGVHRHSERLGSPGVFREGAEYGTRGACAPPNHASLLFQPLFPVSLFLKDRMKALLRGNERPPPNPAPINLCTPEAVPENAQLRERSNRAVRSRAAERGRRGGGLAGNRLFLSGACEFLPSRVAGLASERL